MKTNNETRKFNEIISDIFDNSKDRNRTQILLQELNKFYSEDSRKRLSKVMETVTTFIDSKS